MVVQTLMPPSSDDFMQAAINAAKQVELAQDVNPRVGAVLVNDAHEIVATGFHQGSGSAHAEVDAISKLESAKGLTLYTTLEPCNATGKQGPCSHAIVEAGIRRVVIGQLDPNKRMSGGLEYLYQHEVEVEFGILDKECIELNKSWNYAHKHGRPWVVWKTATTQDGFIAANDAKPLSITGFEAKSDVQWLRSTVGAIVTGTGTALIDDPQLTIRELEMKTQPLRVIVGTRELPTNSKLFDGEKPALHLKGDLKAVLIRLWEEFGVHRVLIEAGARIAKSAWQAKLINEIYWYKAPMVLGDGLYALGDLGISPLEQAARISKTEVNRVGLDELIHFNTDW